MQLPLAEHEGSWAEALAGHDLQLHQTQQPGHDLIPGSQPISSGSLKDVKDRQQGLFNALQQLGCQHVLQKLFLSESTRHGEIASFKDACRIAEDAGHDTACVLEFDHVGSAEVESIRTAFDEVLVDVLLVLDRA